MRRFIFVKLGFKVSLSKDFIITKLLKMDTFTQKVYIRRSALCSLEKGQVVCNLDGYTTD